jgi:hypothetical protein
MTRKHPPTRTSHRWLDLDKIREAVGLSPLRPKRKPPKLIRMRQHNISGPQTGRMDHATITLWPSGSQPLTALPSSETLNA